MFVGRSGKPFPDGLEVYALVDALEPINEEAVDTDLWAFLRWTIHGVGGEWRVDDLDATGRLYQLPFLSPTWITKLRPLPSFRGAGSSATKCPRAEPTRAVRIDKLPPVITLAYERGSLLGAE